MIVVKHVNDRIFTMTNVEMIQVDLFQVIFKASTQEKHNFQWRGSLLLLIM